MPNTVKSFLEIYEAGINPTISTVYVFVNDLAKDEYVVGRPKSFPETRLLF